MKTLLILCLGCILLAGCTSTDKMSPEDRALWEKEPNAPEASGAPPQ